MNEAHEIIILNLLKKARKLQKDDVSKDKVYRSADSYIVEVFEPYIFPVDNRVDEDDNIATI